MPTWGELLTEIKHKDVNGNIIDGLSYDELRVKYLSKLYELNGRNIIA